MSADKPPYRVPSMEEVHASPQHGLTVASTFSGAGGSCLGWRMAGFEVLWANEFVAEARRSYRLNQPSTHLEPRSIREVRGEDLLEATGLEVGELDVLDGSPPCTSFSTSGSRAKGWSRDRSYHGTAQRQDDLFHEYARLLEEVQPRAFVAENVTGLVRGVAKGYFKLILKRLRSAGYRVRAAVVNAEWLGVPQRRKRVIFVGVREDLGVEPAFPTPLPYHYSIREALPWLDGRRVVHDTRGQWGQGDVTERPSPTIMSGVDGVNRYHFQVEGPPRLVCDESSGWWGGEVLAEADDPAPTVQAGGIKSVTWRQALLENAHAGELEPPEGVPGWAWREHLEQALEDASLEGQSIGPRWERLEEGDQDPDRFNLIRPDSCAPSPTLIGMCGVRGAASVTHPTEKRKFTVLEAKRLCGFPDDFRLHGTFKHQWARLGLSVPPLMMMHIGAAIRDRVLRAADGLAPWDAPWA